MTIDEFINKYYLVNFTTYYDHITIGGNHGSRHQKSYIKAYCGFDIETTKIGAKTYPWHYQFQFNDDYIEMRYVEEFVRLIEFLKKKCYAKGHHTKSKLIIFIHNMSYEMSFLRKYIEWDNVFAKEMRKPVYMETGNVIFMDSMLIENKSLANLAKDYNLPTRKMTGDLDYSIIRNGKSSVTFTEARYNHNDVLILRDYAKLVYFPNYIEGQGYAPITNTQKVRQAMIEFIQNAKGVVTRIKSKIAELFPPTLIDYQSLFRWLFRGGYTHCNKEFSNVILRDIIGYDFTSSYPSVIFTKYFPMTCFKLVDLENITMDTIKHYLNKMCCILTCTFTNIRSKTTHSIESASKTMRLEGCRRDNGRVMSADFMEVMLTELDYQSYKDFYDWDEMSILDMKIAKRGYLPDYVVKPMLDFYKLKGDLKGVKGKEVEYMRAKGMLNSFYGCMVTRLVFEDIVLDEDGNWAKVEGQKTYEKMKHNLLSPYWGVWVTAHARRNELSLLHKLKDVVYSDTDSHKCLKRNEEYNSKIIERYNQGVYEELQERCKFYDVPEDTVIDTKGDLGLYDCKRKSLGYANYDGEYIAFKTLGAKRYIYLDQNWERHVTVAGLPKGVYEKENYSIVDFFSNFNHGYTAHSCKLSSSYFDEESSDIVTDFEGNTEIMTIKSGVTLEPIDFTMSIDSDYWELIKSNEAKYILTRGRMIG